MHPLLKLKILLTSYWLATTAGAFRAIDANFERQQNIIKEL